MNLCVLSMWGGYIYFNARSFFFRTYVNRESRFPFWLPLSYLTDMVPYEYWEYIILVTLLSAYIVSHWGACLLPLEFFHFNIWLFIIFFFSSHGSYEVLLTLDMEKHRVDGPIYYYVFNSLLYCLLVLHIYWWVLMYRMLVKQIQARGQLSEDVRSGEWIIN